MRKVDYLIIGQGIAGTMIAFFAKKAGKKILVIDQSRPHSSSKIAAGLMNPITGRKFVKSWKIDDLLPFAIQTYQEFTELLGEPFFEQKTSSEHLRIIKLKQTGLFGLAFQAFLNTLWTSLTLAIMQIL